MTILDDIVAYKKEEVAIARAACSFSDLHRQALETAAPRGFLNALKRKSETGFALIAEIKRRSPSKGLIRPDFSVPEHASAYFSGGAACLSVLTDEPSFGGSDDFLDQAKQAVALPVLRKDFIVDEYQIPQSRQLGADCVLLIMACLSDDQARDLHDGARSYGMDVLIEVHDEEEMERALVLNPSFIGVNNRNLNSFEVSLQTTQRLADMVSPECFLVSESGIATHNDLITLSSYGARAFLIGESLMRQDNVQRATEVILGTIPTIS